MLVRKDKEGYKELLDLLEIGDLEWRSLAQITGRVPLYRLRLDDLVPILPLVQ